uniref:Uncharacterized protein n=1 Tax=Lepeophtheirus salmonis TaxID=72036 RepID=A0A0K2V6P0_LEPSM
MTDSNPPPEPFAHISNVVLFHINTLLFNNRGIQGINILVAGIGGLSSQFATK